MLALLQTTSGYRILGLLHILSAMAAFGPLFLYTPLKKTGETTLQELVNGNCRHRG